MLRSVKIVVLLSSLICLVPQPALGAEASYGNKKLVNSDLSEILHHGKLDLDKVNITGETRVNGTLNADNSTLQNITINGRGNIKNSTVLGNIRANGMLNLEKVKVSGFVEVSGYVQTDKANIEGEMIISADKIEIKDSTVFRIRIRPTLNKLEGDQSKQVLILSNTKVLGNVIFESENGEIIQDKSTILGTIQGIPTQKKK
jgi:cytoskeletal protein CcmA (bactofilin family)